ncbi:MAG TPA: UxaA family hydrolase [Anaerolineaceae bacterium]
MMFPCLQEFAVVINASLDQVAVAKRRLDSGLRMIWNGQEIILRGMIEAGHRFAIQPVTAGDWVRQYGEPFAISKGLQPGDPVNSATVENLVPQVDINCLDVAPPYLAPWQGELPSFWGYSRADGDAGTRNWVLIVPTSMCSSHEAVLIAQRAEREGIFDPEKYSNVSGVTAIPHPRGCGCPDVEMDSREVRGGGEATMKMLGRYIQHPNVGAALVVELGCEKTSLEIFDQFTGNGHFLAANRADLAALGDQQGKPVLKLSIQQAGGTAAAVRQGLSLLPSLLDAANRTPRTRLPVSLLKLGLKCGGSDAFSGISANPALGHASDLLIRCGGSSMITEIPEFDGAEHLFARRAVNCEVGRKILEAMSRFQAGVSRFGKNMTENPSPGNKKGGLLNITIKSLGALAKSGRAPVQGVLSYGEPVPPGSSNGLYLVYAPGYDQYSTPAVVAAGCQLVCFTTGRGTGIGNAIAPVIKIGSNNALYNRMADDIDINAGPVIEGEETIETMGEKIFSEIIRVASGTITRAEANGHREFAIWAEDDLSL